MTGGCVTRSGRGTRSCAFPLVGPCLSKSTSIGGERFSELAGDERGVHVVVRSERGALDPLGGDDGVLMITEGVLQRGEPLGGTTCLLARGRGDRFEGVARLLRRLADLVQILIRRVGREALHLVAEAFPWLANQSCGDLVDLVVARVLGRTKSGRAGALDQSIEQCRIPRGVSWPGAASSGRRLVGPRSGGSSWWPARGDRVGACPRVPRGARRGRRRLAPGRADRRSSAARRGRGSLHARSRTGRSVRRSDRNRRVATRAWWTPSGSSPTRTIGSAATKRCVPFASVARARSSTVLRRSSAGAGGRSGGASAESPSTRLTFERLPSGFAPAASRRFTTLATIFGLASSATSNSTSWNRDAVRSLRRTTYHVVVDLPDRPSATIPESEPPPVRPDLRDGEQGCGPGDRTDERRRFVGRLVGLVAGERQLVARRSSSSPTGGASPSSRRPSGSEGWLRLGSTAGRRCRSRPRPDRPPRRRRSRDHGRARPAPAILHRIRRGT